MTRIVHPICHVDRQPCLHGLAEFGPTMRRRRSSVHRRKVARKAAWRAEMIRRAPMPVVEPWEPPAPPPGLHDPMAPACAFPSRVDWEQARIADRYPGGRPRLYRPSSLEYRETYLEMLAEPEPFPEPIATSRGGHMPPPMPAPVKALQTAVERAGWATLVQDSAGHVPHATHGRPSAAPKVIWAVRMCKGERGAVAVRTGAAWEFFYVWSPAGFQRFKALGLFQEALG